MADIETLQPSQESLLSGDLDGFISAVLKEDEEPQTPAVESEAPATPETEPQTAPAAEVPAPQPATSWREQLIPEDDPEVDGFFRGKPVGEVLKSQKHAALKIQEQGERLRKLEAQLAAREALADVAKQLQRPESAPAPSDPFAARGLNLSEDVVLRPEKVAEAILQHSQQEAERIANERISAALSQRDKVQLEQSIISAIEQARQNLDIPHEEFATEGYALLEISKQVDPRTATSPQFYENYLKEKARRAAPIFSRIAGLTTAPAAAAPSAPPPPAAPASTPNPPGAKRPAASPQDAASEGTLNLSRVDRAALDEGLSILPNDPEVRKLFEQNYVARVSRRRGE